MGLSLQDVALGSRVPYPQSQSYKAGHVRKGFVTITIAPMGKQPAATFILNRTVNDKGVPRESTERWYWGVTLNGYTGPQNKVASLLHLPCKVTVTKECSLELMEGEFLVARFAYRLGSKHWCLDMAMGSGGGGGWSVPGRSPSSTSRPWRCGAR